MHDGWAEMLPDRTKADRAAWLQFGLALIGGAAVLGSVAGAALGWCGSLRCWCCMEEGQEP